VESTTNLEMLVDENQLSADDFNRESLGRFLFVESESAYTYFRVGLRPLFHLR
jgi:hypothetical protein